MAKNETLNEPSGSASVVIKDNRANMCRQILVNGEALFSITAMAIAPSSFNEQWNPEWRALLIMPWGFHAEGTSMPQNNEGAHGKAVDAS